MIARQNQRLPAPSNATRRPIRVLVVDDSAIVRKLVREALERAGDIEVVGVAPDPVIARDKLIALKPDVMTLDVEMPKLDGISFLKAVMAHQPLPVIILSSITQEGSAKALEALSAGAIDVLAKPGTAYSVGDLENTIVERVRAAGRASFRPRAIGGAPLRPQSTPAPALGGARGPSGTAPWPLEAPRSPSPPRLPSAPTPAPAPRMAQAAAGPAPHPLGDARATPAPMTPRPLRSPAPPQPASQPNVHFAPGQLVAIGASTGGTEALAQVIARLPSNCPPTVVVQHIHPAFVASFAARLDANAKVTVKVAVDGERLEAGQVRLAPGDVHLVVERAGLGYRTVLRNGPKVCHQRPAADVLMHSVAAAAKGAAVGVILTGMGTDGAEGLLAMRRAGARTAAQNEETCVVFGMPREALANGAAEEAVPLDRIAGQIVALLKKA
ncbi:chemotaxis response regulator protein-glutamate methylesterase [Myxococcota bacterium]|nr:chemotaxis response regulator protein-glutamate methylesterase [Myxococcota bacterium]